MARGNSKENKTTTDTYVVVRKKPWKDLQDNDYVYNQGDIFPREGLEVSKKRLEELSTINNKIGEILIQKLEKNNDEKDIEDTESTEENKDKDEE